MKILVKFDESIGLEPLQKDISPNETVENLQILISLNYADINTCKLVFNNQSWTNKQAKLREILPYVQKKSQEPETVFEVKVVKKGQLDELTDLVNRVKDLGQKNPIFFIGAIVFVVFIILFLMGQASEEQQTY